VIVRRAGRYDMADLARLYRATVQRELAFLPTVRTAEEDAAYFRSQLFDEHEVWAAEEDARFVGYIAFKPLFVHHLFLDADHLGRGVGTMLLGLAKERYAELGLWTFQGNARARAFYEARGFAAVTFTDGDDNEEKMPDVFYRWRRSAEPDLS
jgi:putative acetyltransferase